MTVSLDPIRLSMQAVREGDGRSAFDLLFVGTVKNPGIAQVTGGADRPYKIDVQNAPGQQGNIIWYRGWDKVDSIQVLFTFWEVGQIDEFYRDYLPLFTDKGKPVGVNVANPVLYANDITKLLLKKAGQLVPKKDNRWTISLTFVEYRKAEVIKAEKAEAADSPKNNKPTVKDKLDLEIERVTAMGKRLGAL